MIVTLIKDFGIHKKGSELEANKLLYNHLLAKGCIKVPTKKAKK